MTHRVFSLRRCLAIAYKEALQLRRDRFTFGMIIGIPVVQLLLFGYAINNDPKHLPTAFVPGEETIFTRSVESALRTSDYFRITGVMSEKDAENALKSGDVSFVINIPTDFTRRLLRGEKPAMLIEADATDPTATTGAIGAVQGIVESVLKRDMKGPLSSLAPVSQSFSITAHKMYNPEGLTRLNIVPGLIGVILALMTCMLTSMALTRERERGNMENLLASPVTPVEIMLGKITPYIVTGHIQVGIVLALAVFLSKYHSPGIRPPSMRRPCSSSPPTSPWASPFPPSPETSSRPCR